MIKVISPHGNISVPTIRRALFVLHPWTRKMAGGGSWRGFRNYLLHYRANPRGVEYMLSVASEFRAKYAANASVELLTEPTLLEKIPERHRSWIGKIWTELRVENLIGNGYDTVIFLYPDAIGLGWKETERKLLHLKAPQYLVINGRKRIFVWDRDSRGALALRRFVAKAWVLEMILGPVLLCVSTILVLYDSLVSQFNRLMRRNPKLWRITEMP